MKTAQRTEYITRDTILRLLSDDEIARVSTAETAAHLAKDDEYIDLEVPIKASGVHLETRRFRWVACSRERRCTQRAWDHIVILLSAHAIEEAENHPN